MRTIHCAIPALFLSLGAFGQTPAPRPEFEVASVKPAEPLGAAEQVNVGLHIDGAQVRFTYLSLKDLIHIAYRLRAYQVDGPDWISSERFDIAAKLPAGAQRDKVPEMLQSLLANRFQLVLHRESKELPVLALVVAKGGLRMKESPPEADAPAGAGNLDVAATGGPSGVSVSFGKGSYYSFGNDKFEAKRLTMPYLADSLARYEADPVVDMTGLTGAYDFVLQLTPEDYRAMLIRAAVGAGVQLPPEALRFLDTNTGDSLTASLERVGLRLERRKAPVDMLIVDKASKTPTAN
jgi:uncharacterized protein (TIGR03435 family)